MGFWRSLFGLPESPVPSAIPRAAVPHEPSPYDRDAEREKLAASGIIGAKAEKLLDQIDDRIAQTAANFGPFADPSAHQALERVRMRQEKANMNSRTAYPVGLVGERNYQAAIARCAEGEPVGVLMELDNPYDELAIAVASVRGETIGYIARDSWLRDAVHGEGKGCRATIKSIERGESGHLGVVIEAQLCEGGLDERNFSRK